MISHEDGLPIGPPIGDSGVGDHTHVVQMLPDETWIHSKLLQSAHDCGSQFVQLYAHVCVHVQILVSAHDDGVDYPKNSISFLEFDKEAFIVTGDGKHRQSTRLGRAIRQILLAVRPDINLDENSRSFGDVIQFLQGRLSSSDDLELVSGPKIAKYYKKENTADVPGSEICKSCMIGKPDSVFDIYTKNPDSVSLLVRLKEGKVSARALVWKLTEPSDCIYLDKIYSVVNSERKLGQFQQFLQIKFPEKKISKE